MARPKLVERLSRRQVLAGAAAGLCVNDAGATVPAATRPVTGLEAYENEAKGVRIFPGTWRPHYRWEHIAWVSPSWPCQDYVWLDFPEAIFTRQGLLFVSAVNPAIQPMLFPNLPAVPWEQLPGGIGFKRVLPNGAVFGGKVIKAAHGVDLELFIRNGGKEPLNDIKLQTCFFLRQVRECAAYTADNKYVHVPGQGWIRFEAARRVQPARGRFRLGWRGGPAVADLPILVTVSPYADRLIACTWGNHTYSLIQNPSHPCMHADPVFPDLEPGTRGYGSGQAPVLRGEP